ncbi:MAG: hypothetical protein LQ340_003095 [Diploschistes diacapsis]|nr:MAG: hypothetical protein LQ340_003095 [Diploschistes diacapsis]
MTLLPCLFLSLSLLASIGSSLPAEMPVKAVYSIPPSGPQISSPAKDVSPVTATATATASPSKCPFIPCHVVQDTEAEPVASKRPIPNLARYKRPHHHHGGQKSTTTTTTTTQTSTSLSISAPTPKACDEPAAKVSPQPKARESGLDRAANTWFKPGADERDSVQVRGEAAAAAAAAATAKGHKKAEEEAAGPTPAGPEMVERESRNKQWQHCLLTAKDKDKLGMNWIERAQYDDWWWKHCRPDYMHIDGKIRPWDGKG